MVDQRSRSTGRSHSKHGRIPNGKVVRPASQVPIQLSKSASRSLEALMNCPSSHAASRARLDRPCSTETRSILLAASFQIAIISKRVSQKVQTRPFFHRSTTRVLFPVLISNWNFPFQPRLDKLYRLQSHLSRPRHKVVGRSAPA